MQVTRSTIRHITEAFLFGILFLFFFQLISDFIEAIYAFGLLSLSFTIEALSVLFFLSPLVLLLFPRGLPGVALILVGELMLVSRLVEVMLDTRGKMIFAGLGVGCFLVFFPAYLLKRSRQRGGAIGLSLGFGLTLGLTLSVLFRTLNSGLDISAYDGFQLVGWFLAIVAGFLLGGYAKPEGDYPVESLPASDDPPSKNAQPANKGRIIGLSLGVGSVFLLLYFAFTSPTVIARWTGANYLLILSILMLSLCVFTLSVRSIRFLSAIFTPSVILIWNLLFVLAMILTILAHQTGFPSDQSAYPLSEPTVTPLYAVTLFSMLALSPVLAVDFTLYARQLMSETPSSRALGGSFTLASVFILLMIFAQVFTTVYDYIPVVGPFFRDKFWLVYLFGGIILTLPVTLVRKASLDFSISINEFRSNILPASMILIGLTTISGAYLTAAKPLPPPEQKTKLKVLTYNIQQGYSQAGLKEYDGQLDVIRSVDADIIGLQESDVARISGGNSDIVRYFAEKLGLDSYYGPKTVVGTFGIALLSKYPLENPQTFYMYSIGEQTATIEAQVTVGGQKFNVFVTHLGNGGPIFQLEEIIARLDGKEDVILMGDFNFRPDTDQYRLTTSKLDDSWLLKWPQGIGGEGLNPARRIDYIFVSPGMDISDSQYLPSPQSDHPALASEIVINP